MTTLTKQEVQKLKKMINELIIELTILDKKLDQPTHKTAVNHEQERFDT